MPYSTVTYRENRRIEDLLDTVAILGYRRDRTVEGSIERARIECSLEGLQTWLSQLVREPMPERTTCYSPTWRSPGL